jgi:preprotein translocase subunit YajC
MLINSAFAQAAGAASTGSSLTGMIVQLLLIFAIFYLLLIRPQQKRIKEHEAKLAAIKRGDNIITGGGIYAKIVSVDDEKDELQTEIANGVIVKIARSTVREVILDEVKAANNNKKSKK